MLHLFDVRSVTIVTAPDHCLGHLVLDVGPHPDFVILLDLLTAKWNVRDFSAESAACFAALRILTLEEFVNLLRHVHDGGERTKRALFQIRKSRLKVKTIIFYQCE